ncbi:hypothetical protein EG850_12480 [Gulosibacter macacae]|uniref:Uncharacterized protein n=1 Tax=Gulosibacter macacae TaxID=2488791 RepID=A0A3P3VVL2_9MICO|nr:hypothetical protein [Gulosibacter macacae]RRJ85666.1 hypothetical protein EG850_12480 [Gulosibacter macacae]
MTDDLQSSEAEGNVTEPGHESRASDRFSTVPLSERAAAYDAELEALRRALDDEDEPLDFDADRERD